MKAKYSSTVEDGRVATGAFASRPGDQYGAFIVRDRLGRQFKILACDGAETGWDHVSVSLKKRTPTWEEMCWIKNLFFDQEEAVLQFHPPARDYVNDHPHCLHLWRFVGGPMPLPDPIMVGTGRKS